MTSQTQLLSPEEIAARSVADAPYLRLPERARVFADRAARLRRLAGGHPMGGYLEAIALVADEQQGLLDRAPPPRLPSAEHVEHCHEHGMPPLDFRAHDRDPVWRDGLRSLLRALVAKVAGRLGAVAAGLERATDAYVEGQASRLLEGDMFGLDIAAAPLVGAGLQAHFTHLAIALGPGAFRRLDVGTICPCCGSRPVASVTRVGASEAGGRYLHCSLCNADWHMVRIKCAACEGTKGVGYLAIDDGKPAHRKAVKAEVCEECGSYLKVCSMTVDPGVEPVADDLATLALDLLVVESGKSPAGVNFMLVHGDPDSGDRVP